MKENKESVRVSLVELGPGVRYGKALAVQQERLAGLMEGVLPPSLVLCEHAPVITLGRNAGESGVLASPETLSGLGIGLCRTGRGGKATVHSPGQAVAYPVLNLRAFGISPKEYVKTLEEWMLSTLTRFGVEGFRREGKPGIYTRRGKIGALGVALSRGYSHHGIAFNVSNDLALYDLILPCGERDIAPVSLKSEGAKTSTEEVFEALKREFERIFGIELVDSPRDEVQDLL
ncbi:lipoyl(octanoyl) transferase [bacterium]|nr:MAG: lipoyl(octanoyl) transferase [bacterium]